VHGIGELNDIIRRLCRKNERTLLNECALIIARRITDPQQIPIHMSY